MDVFTGSIRSETLGLSVPLKLLLSGRSDRPMRVLYLLHGLAEDESSWLAQTTLARYAPPCPLAVVMPAAWRTFYTDTAYGLRYFTFLSEELPVRLSQMLNLADAPAFACGNSMGGYGALKLGLRYPERFAAVAGLSASPIQARMLSDRKAERGDDDPIRHELHTVFGPEVTPENDIVRLAETAASSARKPKILLYCGQRDHFTPYNRALHAHLNTLGYDASYTEHEDAGHDWAYWDARIQDALQWFAPMWEDGGREEEPRC